MCNPPKAWNALTPQEQVDWQQPSYCFSFNRECTQDLLYYTILVYQYIRIVRSCLMTCDQCCCLRVHAELQTTLYMKISLSDFMTVAAARTRRPFFSRVPGKELAVAATASMVASTFISAYW